MTIPPTAEGCCHDGNTPGPSAHLEALGWAFTHGPTQEAYRRSTGEDIAPALARYRQWLEENIIGRADEGFDHGREEAA